MFRNFFFFSRSSKFQQEHRATSVSTRLMQGKSSFYSLPLSLSLSPSNTYTHSLSFLPHYHTFMLLTSLFIPNSHTLMRKHTHTHAHTLTRATRTSASASTVKHKVASRRWQNFTGFFFRVAASQGLAPGCCRLIDCGGSEFKSWYFEFFSSWAISFRQGQACAIWEL